MTIIIYISIYIMSSGGVSRSKSMSGLPRGTIGGHIPVSRDIEMGCVPHTESVSRTRSQNPNRIDKLHSVGLALEYLGFTPDSARFFLFSALVHMLVCSILAGYMIPEIALWRIVVIEVLLSFVLTLLRDMFFARAIDSVMIYAVINCVFVIADGVGIGTFAGFYPLTTDDGWDNVSPETRGLAEYLWLRPSLGLGAIFFVVTIFVNIVLLAVGKKPVNN